MYLLALPMVFVFSLAPTGTSARFQLDVEGLFTHVSAIDGGGAHGRTLDGGAQLGLTIFGRRVVDDDSPVSLQPFLQRVSSFRLVAGGDGSQYAEPNGAVDASSYGGGVTASARIHVHRNFVLDASFGVEQTTSSEPIPRSGTTTLPASVGFGVRFYDAEIAVRYQVNATNDSSDLGYNTWHVPFLAQVEARGLVVVKRRVSLAARVTVERGGASAGTRVTGYLGRRLSITGELHGGLARFADERSIEEWVGGEVGVVFWTRRLVGLGIHYAPAWQHAGNTATGVNGVLLDPFTEFVTHVLSFTVSSRL